MLSCHTCLGVKKVESGGVKYCNCVKINTSYVFLMEKSSHAKKAKKVRVPTFVNEMSKNFMIFFSTLRNMSCPV